MTIYKKRPKKTNRSLGFTIIELLISMAVGSIILMMLMQMIVMNVTAKKAYEYDNFITDQSLYISDYIFKELTQLQPHRVDITTTATLVTVTFTHEYDITIHPTTGVLQKTASTLDPDVLIYDVVNQTITYNGVLIHSINTKVLPGSTITVDYFENTNPDPTTCSDIYDADICGDGILELTLLMAVEINGNLQEVRTFTTRIIV